ncbi:hypothetical protein BpHYR1_022010 [Brachionus plicatilis]|uniref:Uncharacterized protein n=1 Tax=Brachionus plicatilis TaxID=10195 RepID=A0A3M7PNL2_BRAPC|nr:hypothetical protein BpHYR1_022010 [Brachionus plicatilis]
MSTNSTTPKTHEIMVYSNKIALETSKNYIGLQIISRNNKFFFLIILPKYTNFDLKKSFDGACRKLLDSEFACSNTVYLHCNKINRIEMKNSLLVLSLKELALIWIH